MNDAVQKLLRFIDDDSDAQYYQAVAVHSVFGKLIEEHELDNLEELSAFLGEDKFWQIYPVVLEFFFSNVYKQNSSWNAIDLFLSHPKNGLNKDEKDYLKALRFSVLSLYEVIDIKPDQSLRVKDMIRGGDLIEIQEKSLTHYVCQWECLGMRVLDRGTRFEAAGGCLRLSREVAEELAPWLWEMRELCVKHVSSTDKHLSKAQITNYAEVLWASEIAQTWIDELMDAQNLQAPQLYNSEDHAVSPVTIRYPVTGHHGEIAAFFDQHIEFEPDGFNQWVWLEKIHSSNKKNTARSIRGQVLLYEDGLELHVNSRERANILEDLVCAQLAKLAGTPEWHYSDQPAASIQAMEKALPGSPDPQEAPDQDLSLQEKEDILLDIKDQHYSQWIRSRIPALDDKTPRMAKRSKKGRAQLISLLKEIENRENHQARNQGIKAYDMSWMWEELGLEREDVA